MHGHLVAIEVSVERGAHEWVNPNRLPFNQHRFEGLNPEPVEGRRPVEQHGMLLDHLFEDVPHLRLVLLDHLLGLLDRRD